MTFRLNRRKKRFVAFQIPPVFQSECYTRSRSLFLAPSVSGRSQKIRRSQRSNSSSRCMRDWSTVCCWKDSTGVTLWSRRGYLFTNQFPHIARACEQLPPGTLVDGEIVALDANGRISFNLLQHHRSKAHALLFYTFDVLAYRGRSLLNVQSFWHNSLQALRLVLPTQE